MTRSISNQRGVATLIALLMTGMILLLGLAALSLTEDEISIAGNEMQEMRAFYAAEAGLEMAVAQMSSHYDTTDAPPKVGELQISGQEVNSSSVEFEIIDEGPATQEVLTSGTLAGLHALVKTYTVASTATSEIENSKVKLSQTFEAALVPIYQFAVFYENDLWATPLFDMKIDGRVHVNGNMYLQASKGLTFTSRVTASGGIHHGLASGQHSGATADVSFTDAGGTPVSMKEGSGWLDADDAHWHDSAAARWQGMVLDEAFGQKELNLPVANGEAHKLIERGSGNPDSYEHKADLKIIDGIPYANVSGIEQDISGMLAPGTIENKVFYDGREQTNVNATEIDIASLRESGFFPANGVIYSSDSRTSFDALRLTNGSDIGKPLSVFTENPLYIHGDFNSKNKQPVAVAGDAVTILSNKWDDVNSSKSLDNRKPSETIVNAALLTGDTEPTSSNYGGGLENLPRFLEDWESTKLTIRGSMINLWRSRQAKADWSYGKYYTAPTRDWGFDNDFSDPSKLPPESPTVRIFQRRGWMQEDIAFTP